MNATVVLAMSAPLWFATPAWLQVSLVGCTWGGLVLVGLGCSWSRHRLLSGLGGLCLAALAQRSLRELTDLEHNALWMVVACTLAGGWAIGWILTPWSSEVRQPRTFSNAVDAPVAQKRISRWSMWDIGGLATLVGTLSWIVPRIESQFDLLCRIAPALLGGMLVSLMAVEWGWRDRWSLRQLSVLALGIAAVGMLCVASAPAGLNPAQLLSWALAGPASAMAAQGLTVLSYVAARRIDTRLALLKAHAS